MQGSCSQQEVQLPQPGIPGFTPALVTALNASPYLRGWPVDGTLTAVLLLALMARRGGVLIEATNVPKVAKVAGAHTASVFGLETRFVHLSSSSVASDVALDARRPSGSSAAIDLFELPEARDSIPAHRPGRAIVVTGLEGAPPSVLVRLRSEVAAAEREGNVPLIIWVRDEDRPDEAPSWLIDMFACFMLLYADDLATPRRHLSVTALIPPDYIRDLRSLLLLTHIHPPLESHINNLLAALSLHPSLEANLSARATASLSTLVKAQRILAGTFDLPDGWQDNLHAWQAAKSAQAEYDAGAGSTLPASALRSRVMGDVAGYGGGPGGVDTWSQRAGETPTPVEMLGPGANDWYCDPGNVEAAWELAVRHRVRSRQPGQAPLFALDGSAQERLQYARQRHTKETARQQRKEVDDALVQVLHEV
ncbi:hypothetical protein CspeluHIS016_0502010 [Cutaneotrichosporon spelunceum]|uniref:Uncharacterized protein n=1 Tax=Cutaneotrichosporon spelunceum TaxID=1672016 RepID=A0AAD3TWK6_9TREE|nr:hypothetical protein CspeluHIS016_0502010 [Cutaneotrichosporon spelunceum]